MATQTRKRKISRRKTRRKYTRKNPARKTAPQRPKASDLMRPRIYRKGKKFYRGRRSTLPQEMKLQNPKLKRRTRRNPKRRMRFMTTMQKTFSRERIMTLAAITGGVGTGFMAKPLIVNIMPEAVKDAAWFKRGGLGIIHILLGSLVIGYTKNKNARYYGMAVASTGLYDIIQQNIPQLGLPEIPETNILSEQMLGTSYEFGKRSALGASYQVPKRPTSPVSEPGLLGASYEAPATQPAGLSGSENPYEDISW